LGDQSADSGAGSKLSIKLPPSHKSCVATDTSTGRSPSQMCTWAYESQELKLPMVTHSQPILNADGTPSDLSGSAAYELTIKLGAGRFGSFEAYDQP